MRLRFRKSKEEKIKEMVDRERDSLDPNELCEQSVDGVTVMENPHHFLEVNIIKKKRYVDSFYVLADVNDFVYDKKKYKVREKGIYLLPRTHVNHSFFIPCSFYYEGCGEPVNFKQTNTGITGKALSLLYKNQLYKTLLKYEDKKYNLFIVILLIVQLIMFGVFIYISLNGLPSGGVLPA